MEISSTDHSSVPPIISDQDLKPLRPKSSMADSRFHLLRNQRSDTIDHHNDFISSSDVVNHGITKSPVLSVIAESIRSVEDRLFKSIGILSSEHEELVDFQETLGEEGRSKQKREENQREFWEGRMSEVVKLAEEVESKIKSYVENSENEKRETKRRVVALSEENRDISGLLRVALSEKEGAEKKLKGLNEQKRLALLQIAERGLQKVGLGFRFGFGFGSTEENGNDEEADEEEDSVIVTMEKTMKNLWHEISQLRRSLDESMLDNERLQKLTEKQDRKLGENAVYINGFENREMLLARNVEELVMEIREAEAEVSRWREACELEVKAGKLEVEERNRVILILKAEMEKTRSELAISEGKLKLKEELAKAAMAAEEAAEKSLQISDRKAVELIGRIEQLTRQLEEADVVERNCKKLRHKLCHPWQAITTATAAIRCMSRRDEITRGMSVRADTRALLRDSN